MSDGLGRLIDMELRCSHAAEDMFRYGSSYAQVRDAMRAEFRGLEIDVVESRIKEAARRANVNGTAPDPRKEDAGLDVWDAGDLAEPPAPRGWLLGNTFCRKFVSSLIADGGVGKTALRLVQYISMAIGRSLTGEHVFQRSRVLVVSLEDGRDEIERRILAAARHHGVSRDELRGHLLYAAPGRDGGKLMVEHDRTLREGQLAKRLESLITKHGLDVIALDPFVKAHGVNENDNHAIDQVVQILAGLAIEHDVAVDISHHTSKGIAEPGNANRGRGASAMKDGARLTYTLAPMSTDEANAFGIPDDERRFLVRMDSAKVNITPRLELAKWFRLVGVQLDNATKQYPRGDNVQTVMPWEPPETWGSMSNSLCQQILHAIDEGLPNGECYSDAGGSRDRAVWRVVTLLAPHKTEAQAREIIRTWVKEGVLVRHEYRSPNTRKTVVGLRSEKRFV